MKENEGKKQGRKERKMKLKEARKERKIKLKYKNSENVCFFSIFFLHI